MPAYSIRRHPLLFTALSLLALASLPLQATTYMPVADEHLAVQADLIARVEIGDARVDRFDGRVMTEYNVNILDLIKGQTNGSHLTLRVIGGSSPELGMSLKVFGAPQFGLGQKALLFLVAQADGSYRLQHFLQGAFYEVRQDGEALFARDTSEARVLKITRGATDSSDQVSTEAAPDGDGWRHADRFVHWLRDRVAGIERQADYRLPRPADRDQFRSEFTLIGGQSFFRWFQFDDNVSVRWRRHVDGQDGLSDGGRLAIVRALRAWTNEPNTPVRYLNAGTTASDLGFSATAPVGENVILFDDRNDDISSNFSCRTGGTLAVGGITFVEGGNRSFKGEQWRPIFEAAIVINDGVSCILSNNQSAAEELYTHELGHTLGLGHACGDGASPDCGSSSRFDDAILGAFISDDGRGATLGGDDVEGLRYLYQSNFSAAPCSLPPGHGRFCSSCSPCGVGQGDCDNNAQCGAGLICVFDVGARHGFNPNIDVCERPGGEPPPPPPPTGCPFPDGHGRFCTDCGPCIAGEGDCDNDAECAPGLRCSQDVGAQFGFNPNIDVCTGDATSCTRLAGHGRFCTECGPCTAGQGDCDNDAECAPGLTCVNNIGAQFGFPPAVDVCQ